MMRQTMETTQAYQLFDNYKLENIKRLFFAALLIYPSMAFSDYSLAGGDFWFYFASRVFFLSPYIIIFFSLNKIKPEHIDFYGIAIFISMAIGASVPSYFFGGLTSDYYFGITVVSFVQFIIMPLRTSQTIFVELVYILLYFPLNTLPFDHPDALLTKQLSNYLSFAFIKIAVSDRFHSMLLESFRSMELNRKLEKKETVQIILGELCHLLNNPLFISTSLIKRLRKKKELKEDKDLVKAIEANDRMKEILKEMLKVQEQNELDIEDNKTLKEFFKHTDASTKIPRQ
jgi:hypothetical protein